MQNKQFIRVSIFQNINSPGNLFHIVIFNKSGQVICRSLKLRGDGCGKLVGEDVELYAAVAAGFVCDGVNIQIRGSEIVVFAAHHGIIVRFRRGIRFVPLFWEQGGGFE